MLARGKCIRREDLFSDVGVDAMSLLSVAAAHGKDLGMRVGDRDIAMSKVALGKIRGHVEILLSALSRVSTTKVLYLGTRYEARNVRIGTYREEIMLLANRE